MTVTDVPGMTRTRRTGHTSRRGRSALALAAGLLVAASLPPMGFWPLAFVGVAVLDRVIAGQPARARFRLGALAGAALLAPTTWWMQALTLPGWAIASATFAGLLGLALAAVPPAAPARWVGLPAAWLLWEAVRGRWPFGGVPLSTLAVGQAGGPLAPLARVGGGLFVGFVTVVAGVALAALIRRQWRAACGGAALVAAALAVAALAPSGEGLGRRLDVDLVQGGGPQGTRAIDTDERDVVERHLAASELVQPPVDLVVWPEDVVDIDGRLRDAPEGAELAGLAQRLDTVLVAGVIEQEGDRFTNEAMAFDGADGGRVVDRAGKERRVPFGEYVPFRSLIEPFAPDILTSRDALVARGPAVLDTPVGRLGVVISWEVFFPDRARDAIGNGGQVLLNPTNGSSFTGTQVQTQQVASSRLRAIETGRWVVQVAPTGFSALVAPGGRVVERTGVSEQRVLHGTVELRTGRTWAVAVGDWLPLGLAVAALAAAWALQRRRPDLAVAIAADPDRSGASGRSTTAHAGSTA